ncbi:MAG: DNA polymerase, partial [Nitrososphaera sp.]|nr:DNA polymerase [Nitrososphaera sp.]
KQIHDLLYNRLKLPVKRNRETGNPTANKYAIIELAGKYNHPILSIILAIRKHRDFVERYLTAKIDADGRIRCSFDITGTRTGRLSSRQSIYGSGTNLQNIPARRPEGEAIRRMFLADEGKVFVHCDYSQAEARIVAHLSGANDLIDLFGDPSRDIHKVNAARIFGKALGDSTDTERYLAKRVIHASNYGMEEDRLVQVVNEDADITGIRIDRHQARSLIARYFMLYPQIREVFWREVESELRFSRTLSTPFGRRRTFYGRWDEKLLREAYSYIPQSTVGDLGAKAIIECYNSLEPRIEGLQTLLNVHDSVMVQCFNRDVERVAEEMASVMAIPITIKGRTFTIPTDCKVGSNWGTRPKLHPELNPRGLVSLDTWLKGESANARAETSKLDSSVPHVHE